MATDRKAFTSCRQGFLPPSTSELLIIAHAKQRRWESTLGEYRTSLSMTVFLPSSYAPPAEHLYLATMTNTCARKCALLAPVLRPCCALHVAHPPPTGHISTTLGEGSLRISNKCFPYGARVVDLTRLLLLLLPPTAPPARVRWPRDHHPAS